MTPHRLAGIGATAVLALFVVGGTALATSNAVTPTPVPVPSFVAAETTTTPDAAAPDITTPTTPDTTTPDTTTEPTRPDAPSPVPAAEGEPIGPDGARAAALAAVGGGRVTELEADREDGGRVEWEVEVTDGATVHELRIDGITGEVLERQVEGSSTGRSGADRDADDDRGDRSGRGGDSDDRDDDDDSDDDSDSDDD